MPLRRSHAKSHHGCTQCKERRIKCDENRPHCGSCQKKSLLCSLNTHLGHPHNQGVPTRETGNAARLPLGELELFHHWHTATASSLAQNEALSRVFQTHAPRKGLTYPFLMHAILGISALHLSHEVPDYRRRIYTEIATQHHSLALSLCTPLLSKVTPENCDALFACSLLIASFNFASRSLSLHFAPMGVSEVIEVFKLVRGTASIVEKARPWIEQGDMRLLLKFTRCAQQIPKSKHSNEVHTQLEILIGQHEDAVTSTSEIGARAAVLRSTKHLLDVFDSCVASDNQSTILAWPAIVDLEFMDLLLEAEPGSLVTLAHYGAVLHVMTRAWWMEGWGKFLVNLVADCLDASVQSAIAWPLAVVNDDQGPS